MAAARPATAGQPRPRTQDVDRHVGRRLRERRMVLGLSQQQTAKLIGVTYQQVHKYEKGVNRIAAGWLFQIAQALGVEIGYFFEGFGQDDVVKPTRQQRLLLELARDFVSMPKRKHQEAVCQLARALAHREPPAAGGEKAGADAAV
jgi:transcriptional regulator with XRE-family HTH domain